MNPEGTDPVTGGEVMLFILGGVMTAAVLAIAVALGFVIRREEREAARKRAEAGE